MKAIKKAFTSILAAAVLIATLSVPTVAKAGGTSAQVPYNAAGVFIGTEVTDYSKAFTFTKKGYNIDHSKTQDKYVNKLRMCMDYSSYDFGEDQDDTIYYSESGLGVYTRESTTELISVKTSSKNLKAIISYSSTYKYQNNDPSYNGYIRLLAKKPGKYKVTATFRLKSGAKATATCQVLVTKTNPIYWDFPSTKALNKNVAYAGRTFNSDKVKVLVKKGKGISGIKLYYTDNNSTGTSVNNYGWDANDNWYDNYETNTKQTSYKIKNGGIVKLPKKTTYTATFANETNYKNVLSGYSRKTTSTSTTTYNNFYPEATVYCFYKDSFYGIQTYETLNLYKNKKQ